jgi:hypothetical protein
VSRVAAILLVGLLALCPAVCGVEEDGRGAHAHTASGGTVPPAHCPEDGSNCICQGAVQVDAVRLAHPDVDGLTPLLATANPTPLHPIAHLTQDGSPTGLAGLGERPAIRAFLQNFRC